LPAERLSVVSPALDDPGCSVDRSLARSALQIESNRFVIGYAGNLDNYQSLEVLAGAIARLGAKPGARAPLWLVVTHGADPRFEPLLARSGAAPWTRVLEVASFADGYRATAACDALVLPRQVRSGLPIKLLNYLAQGGVVVAASGGFGLVVDGEDGLVVDDTGHEALAVALARVAANESLAERLGRGARSRFLRDLTWATALPALEAVYAEAIGAERAAETARAMLR
jgi:glycosyltransferase involved in cell wall biosynthesis